MDSLGMNLFSSYRQTGQKTTIHDVSSHNSIVN